MQPFEPHSLPLTDLDWRQLLPLVGQANAALARYDGLLASIPNPAVMLSPLTTQEAVLSSDDVLPAIDRHGGRPPGGLMLWWPRSLWSGQAPQPGLWSL